MTSALCSLIFAAQAAVGCGFGGHHGKILHRNPIRVAPVQVRVQIPIPTIGFHRPIVEVCDLCGIRDCRVDSLLVTLATAPRWRDRDNAAHALRKYDWRRHPEVALGLAAALRDPEEEVREESAESLQDLDPPPCLPEVHGALAWAATADPDHATRRDARRALDRLDQACYEPCSICTPGLYDVQGPIVDSIGSPFRPEVSGTVLEPSYGPAIGPASGEWSAEPPLERTFEGGTSELSPYPPFESSRGFEELPPLSPPLLPGPSDLPEVPSELAPLDFDPVEATSLRVDRLAEREPEDDRAASASRTKPSTPSTTDRRATSGTNRRRTLLQSIFRRRR